MKVVMWPLAFALAACGPGGDGGAPDAPMDAPAAAAKCASTQVPAANPPESPSFTLDPLGPFVDVTCDWQRFQPADAFCVKLDAPEFTPGGVGTLTDGNDPACAFSGFTPQDTGLYKVVIATPILCPGCRRLFIDLSRIPPDDPALQLFYAHGHAFYRMMSANPGYTLDPIAHSPNTKNFTNDKLLAPAGSPLEQLIGAADTRFMSYVTGTRFFIHTAIQGPYYIGPWYVNRDGERIGGVYLDVNVIEAAPFGAPDLDAIRYMTAYNSGQLTCPDNAAPFTSGGDLLYGGCVDRIGGSSDAWDPFQ